MNILLDATTQHRNGCSCSVVVHGVGCTIAGWMCVCVSVWVESKYVLLFVDICALNVCCIYCIAKCQSFFCCVASFLFTLLFLLSPVVGIWFFFCSSKYIFKLSCADTWRRWDWRRVEVCGLQLYSVGSYKQQQHAQAHCACAYIAQ